MNRSLHRHRLKTLTRFGTAIEFISFFGLISVGFSSFVISPKAVTVENVVVAVGNNLDFVRFDKDKSTSIIDYCEKGFVVDGLAGAHGKFQINPIIDLKKLALNLETSRSQITLYVHLSLLNAPETVENYLFSESWSPTLYLEKITYTSKNSGVTSRVSYDVSANENILFTRTGDNSPIILEGEFYLPFGGDTSQQRYEDKWDSSSSLDSMDVEMQIGVSFTMPSDELNTLIETGTFSSFVPPGLSVYASVNVKQ